MLPARCIHEPCRKAEVSGVSQDGSAVYSGGRSMVWKKDHGDQQPIGDGRRIRELRAIDHSRTGTARRRRTFTAISAQLT